MIDPYEPYHPDGPDDDDDDLPGGPIAAVSWLDDEPLDDDWREDFALMVEAS